MPAWSRPGNPARPASKPVVWMTAAGMLVACLAGLSAAYGFGQATQAQTVLVMAGTVLQGDVIQASDLGVVEVWAPGAPTTPSAQRAAVVGTRALSTLPVGSLLAPGSFGTPELGDGMARVQVRLSPSQVPSGLLPGGQRLILIGLPGADRLDDAPLLVAARVVCPPVEQIDGTVVVDVAVAATDVIILAPYLLDSRVTAVVVPP